MKPSDKFQKERHPYDDGYWARYDSEPFDAKRSKEWRAGWTALNRELRAERKAR